MHVTCSFVESDGEFTNLVEDDDTSVGFVDSLSVRCLFKKLETSLFRHFDYMHAVLCRP